MDGDPPVRVCRTYVLPEQQTAGDKTSIHEASTRRAYYAKKFDMELDRGSNLKLYEAVDQWIGVKYKYASCTKSGVDCSCLVNAIYREAYQCNHPAIPKDFTSASKSLMLMN